MCVGTNLKVSSAHRISRIGGRLLAGLFPEKTMEASDAGPGSVQENRIRAFITVIKTSVCYVELRGVRGVERTGLDVGTKRSNRVGDGLSYWWIVCSVVSSICSRIGSLTLDRDCCDFDMVPFTNEITSRVISMSGHVFYAVVNPSIRKFVSHVRCWVFWTKVNSHSRVSRKTKEHLWSTTSRDLQSDGSESFDSNENPRESVDAGVWLGPHTHGK